MWKKNELLRPKLLYQFSCFIANGDFIDDITPENISSSFNSSPHSEENKRAIIDEVFIEKAVPFRRKQSIEINDSEQEENIKVEERAREEERLINKRRKMITEGYLSKDGDNPQVYSMVIGVLPNSFISSNTVFDPKSPPPTYLTEEELYSMENIAKDQILKGFSIPVEGGLQCTDKSIMKRQSGIIRSMIGQLIKNMGTAGLSMPIRIFEAKGLFERVADLWRFAPIYLNNAVGTTGLNRFKQVIIFAIAGIYCSMQQLKPFNPLLGETFQALMPDGTKIYIEHASHVPIIYNFLLIGADDQYKLYGYHNFKLKMSPNTLEAFQEGPNTIEFKDGQKIKFIYPKAKVHGLIIGKRMVYPSGMMRFEDPLNNIRAVVIFNYGKKKGLFSSRVKGSKIDHIEGIIYKANKNIAPNDNAVEIKHLKDVEEVLDKITGSWLENIKIADTEYWNINKVLPVPLKFVENPLPSDWRFREDIIWLRRNNMDYSQEWKLKLEFQQRRDRATRCNYGKK